MNKLILLITILFFGLKISYSQPGQPNPSFGNKGIIINYVPSEYSDFGPLSISNGKIFVIGYTDFGENEDNILYRYNLSGTHDSAFGVNGKQPTYQTVTITAIQKDGKIVAVGENSISRYNADGQPDTLFNGEKRQRVIDPVIESISISEVAIQGDGKIVVAGEVYTGRTYGIGVYRFNSDGSIDKNFADSGKLKTFLDGFGGNYGSLLIQPDGKIVIGSGYRIVRYNADGSFDKTFHSGGKIRLDFLLNKMVLQPDGKFIVAGSIEDSPYVSKFVIARFTSSGSKDTSFNGKGELTGFNISPRSLSVSVALQDDGKILLAGTIEQKKTDKIFLARFKTNGSIDSTFGYAGFQETAGLADGSIDTIFQEGGADTALSFAHYEFSSLVIFNNKAYVAAERDETIGNNDYSQGMLLSYLLDESKTTSVQFTDPIYSAAFYTAPANINIAVKIVNPAPGTTIKKVDFYKDDTLVYTDSVSPYNYTLKNTQQGEYSLTAKATDNHGIITTSAIRTVSVLPNQPPLIFLSTTSAYNQLIAPANIYFSATGYDPDPDGKISKVEFYDGLKLIYTDSVSPYDFTWNNVPIGAHSVTAKATDNSGLTGTNLYPYQFTVQSSIAPSVYLASPYDYEYFAGPSATVDITAQARAMYAGGIITKVEFYNGTALLNTDSIYPYSFTWKGVAPGSYLISAKATNSSGASATSSLARIFVVVGESPVIQITSPAKDTNIILPDPILLTAEASDPYSFIASVRFYNDDSTLLFTENYAPFSRLWQPAKTGSYHITAVATDYHGLSTTSVPVHITVLHNRPPVVYVISPLNGVTYTEHETINVQADAFAHGVKIKSVEFFNGATLMHTAEAFPYSFAWNDVAAGAYTITAKANDTYGRSTISSPVTITVASNDSLSINSRPSSTDTKAGLKADMGVQLAPNPAKNILQINITGFQNNKPSAISIISASGVVMKMLQSADRVQTISVNVSSFASGTYVVKIIKGDKVMYKRFVKL